MTGKRESVETGTTDVAGEYFKRYLVLGSRIPFIKVPLFFIGSIALAVKSVEGMIQRKKDQENMAVITTTEENPWTALDE